MKEMLNMMWATNKSQISHNQETEYLALALHYHNQ